MTFVGRLLNGARESLFFLPTVIVILCASAAGFAQVADRSDVAERLPFVLSVTAEGGRAIATTVAGATITVAAIVFSITALTTQMASSQYSPRSVGGFFSDPLQQAITGLVIGTFTYSLLILAGLGSVLGGAAEPLPSLAITLDIALGIISAIAIVGYLDHSLRRMQIDSVVYRIAQATLNAIRDESHHHPRGGGDLSTPGHPESAPVEVTSVRSGWIVSINAASLVKALPPDSTARVNARVGEPVSKGDQLVTLWTGPDVEDVAGRARRSIKVGSKRSIKGDPTFGIRQLVDIALRALSPGVNDPSTAADVIHHLKVPVREVLLLPPPLRVLNGPEGRRVFLPETPSRSEMIREAFSEVRLASRGQPHVLRALIEVLEDLAMEMGAQELEGRLGEVERELRLTVETARKSGLPESDLEFLLATRRIKDEESD